MEETIVKTRALMFSLIAAAAISSTPTQAAPVCQTLYGGQTIEVGTLCVDKQNDQLQVTYTTTNQWYLSEVHLWIGRHIEDMPQTSSGAPIPGQFPYSAEFLDTQSYTFFISLAELGVVSCPDQLLVAAHASVVKKDGSVIVQQETAWADGTPFPDTTRWGWFFEFTVPCDDDVGNGQRECDTAFAFGDTTFIDLGLTRSRWGWELTNITEGSYSAPLYAGAGRNNINKAEYVGDLYITYQGGTLTVQYVMFPGYGLDETHLYAGYEHVSTIAPGQFGNTRDDLGGASNDTYTLYFDGRPLFLVAHGVACWDR
jgi:hypothetical protein